MILSLTKILVLLACLTNGAQAWDNEVVVNEFPSIWDSIRGDKSYHLIFQLQISKTLDRITIEEWASFEHQLFRLDLITGASRITYLSNGKTDETFRYKPFTCDLMDKNSDELEMISSLFKGYNLNDASLSGATSKTGTIAHGLGPLWLAASESGKIKRINNDDVGDHKFMEDYVAFEVSFEQSETSIPYDLRFFFDRNRNRMVQAIEWVETELSGERSVEARARILMTDLAPLSDSVFELPIGYGCQRSPKFEHKLDDDIWVEILHPNGPNQIELEIATSMPLDMLMREWYTQKHFVSITRGALRLARQEHNYFITQAQARDHESSNLWSTKQVWSAVEPSDRAVVYTIDRSNSSCSVSHSNAAQDHAKLVFPGKENQHGPTPFTLSVDLITGLFNNNSDYHLIRVQTDTETARLSEAFYEKRIDRLRGIWQGPVSVVKRVNSYLEYLDELSLNTEAFTKKFQSSVILYFYSDDKSEILFKATIDLLDNYEIDIVTLLKQTNVGACFNDEQKDDIVIKYALETQELAKRLQSIESLIEELFCLNLFATTPIQPLQISNLELTFDNFFMHAKLSLIDIPLNQLFAFEDGKTLVPRPGKEASLIKQLAPKLERCASACDYYNCFRFAYDSTLQRCKIELEQDAATAETLFTSELYESRQIQVDSPWFQMTGGKTHLRPQLILRLLNEFVANRSEENDDFKVQESVPLRLTISSEFMSSPQKDEPESYDLIPVSVSSDLDSMNEYVREKTMESNDSDATNSGELVRVEDWSRLKVQYNLLFEDRAFKVPSDGNKKLEVGLAYEQCAQICQDTNCRSFSYCDFGQKQSCYTKSMHSSSDIHAYSEYAPNCSIFSLDYLSKFDNYGPSGTPVSFKKRVEGISARDCALTCMEEESFNCQGFYLCENTRSGPSSVCLMQAKHVTDPAQRELTREVSSQLIGASRCRLYSRSYLSHFDKYYEQAIDYDEKGANFRHETVGFGADECARNCIQRSCFAFDVCLERSSSSSGGNKFAIRCHYANNEMRRSNLRAEQACTTFVLSDRSQFSLKKTILIMGLKPDELALDKPIEEPDETEEPDKDVIDALTADSLGRSDYLLGGSHWFSKMLTCMIGILFGIVAVSLWRQRGAIKAATTRLASELQSS